MSNNKWYAFKLKVFVWIAQLIPEGAKRQVLYELRDRVPMKNESDDWFDVPFMAVYQSLRD